MAINTNADIHPITIHNFVVDNNILSLEFSSNGLVLETVNCMTTTLSFVAIKNIYAFVLITTAQMTINVLDD